MPPALSKLGPGYRNIETGNEKEKRMEAFLNFLV
jgi:hypothetical protein